MNAVSVYTVINRIDLVFTIPTCVDKLLAVAVLEPREDGGLHFQRGLLDLHELERFLPRALVALALALGGACALLLLGLLWLLLRASC